MKRRPSQSDEQRQQHDRGRREPEHDLPPLGAELGHRGERHGRDRGGSRPIGTRHGHRGSGRAGHVVAEGRRPSRTARAASSMAGWRSPDDVLATTRLALVTSTATIVSVRRLGTVSASSCRSADIAARSIGARCAVRSRRPRRGPSAARSRPGPARRRSRTRESREYASTPITGRRAERNEQRETRAQRREHRPQFRPNGAPLCPLEGRDRGAARLSKSLQIDALSHFTDHGRDGGIGIVFRNDARRPAATAGRSGHSSRLWCRWALSWCRCARHHHRPITTAVALIGLTLTRRRATEPAPAPPDPTPAGRVRAATKAADQSAVGTLEQVDTATPADHRRDDATAGWCFTCRTARPSGRDQRR